MNKIKIITDSSSDLSREQVKENDIDMIVNITNDIKWKLSF